MKYRTKLQDDRVKRVRLLWEEGKTNTEIALILLAEYWEWNKGSLRKQVEYLITQFREEKDRSGTMNDFVKEEEMVGKEVVSWWVHKYDENWKKTGTFFVKNPQYDEELQDIREAIIEEMREAAPVYPIINREPCKDPHLLVVDLADLHVWKLCSAFETGEEYNSQIAVKRAKEWVEGILQKCLGYNIEKILFVGGNDILHIDTPKRTTTSWTPQDTDWMRYDNFLMAKKLLVDILETLLAVADVHFIYCPSNHDYMSGFMLCDSVYSRFSKNPNITFDVDMKHRKYYRYYNNLIGVTHWDGAKEKDLPLLMAEESLDWSTARQRYIYGHHLHHKTSKDYVGVTYETLRSPSATDSRHARNWYQHAKQALEGFIHHPEHWQIARFTHFFTLW